MGALVLHVNRYSKDFLTSFKTNAKHLKGKRKMKESEKIEVAKINAAIGGLLDIIISKTTINSLGRISEDFKNVTLTVKLPSELLQAVEEVRIEMAIEKTDQILSLLISTLIGIGYNTQLKKMIKEAKNGNSKTS
jgi:hypothetical protein